MELVAQVKQHYNPFLLFIYNSADSMITQSLEMTGMTGIAPHNLLKTEFLLKVDKESPVKVTPYRRFP